MKFDHIFIHPSNFDESVKFYKNALGFSEASTWGGAGEPRGMTLVNGDVTVVLAERHESAEDLSWDSGVSETRPTIHLSVHDLDSAYSLVNDAAKVVVPPEDTHWGTRWFVLKDPDGNLIAVNRSS